MKHYKKKILSVMQLPPPIHGQSIMNQAVYKSKYINTNFHLKTIPLHFAELGNIRKPSIKKLWKMIYYFFVILKNLIVFKPDLVYFTLSPTGLSFYRDTVYAGLIKFFNIPIVFHLHGKGIKEKIGDPFNKLLYSWIFKHSYIILLSPLLRYDIEDVFESSNCLYFLPNGIPCKSPITPPFNENNSVPVILFLSNIARTKGVLVLIEAIKILTKKNIKLKVKLVGQIHQSLPENKLKKILSDPSISKCVEYLGPKYDNDKTQIFDSSDIFVFPTHHEAFPLVILEAMQAGLPVISTFEGAIPEIVDDGLTGFLVEKKNPEQLAIKIECLLKKSSIGKKMGLKAKTKFEKHYTLEAFEINLTHILKSILFDQTKRDSLYR